MKTFEVSTPCNLRDFTDSVFPQGAFCFSRLLSARDIKVNGKRAGENIRLSAGDTVVYYTTAAQESARSHGVIYSDENVLVADKFSGVTSEGLSYELGLTAVHRLDRNTAGVMIFARSDEAAEELLKAFKERRVHKVYLAICKNAFKKSGDKLTAYLKKDAEGAEVKIYDKPVDGGAVILTDYKILETSGSLALAEITLHTGRTHQIRAHMAHIGCPVLGDGKYGDRELNKAYGLSRQALFAVSLTLNTGGVLSYLDGKTFKSGQAPVFPPEKK